MSRDPTSKLAKTGVVAIVVPDRRVVSIEPLLNLVDACGRAGAGVVWKHIRQSATSDRGNRLSGRRKEGPARIPAISAAARDTPAALVAPVRIRDESAAMLDARKPFCGRHQVVTKRDTVLGVMSLWVIHGPHTGRVELVLMVAVPPARLGLVLHALVDDVLRAIPALLPDCMVVWGPHVRVDV